MNHNKSNAEANDKKVKKAVPVVAIGGSAGAIQSMKELLESLSPDTGLAFVYIQHLSPDYDSNLTSILGRATKMEVLQASHKVPVEPNKVYVIPPTRT